MNTEDALPSHHRLQVGIWDLDHAWAFLTCVSRGKSWLGCSSPSCGAWEPGLRVWARGRASQCREQLRPAEHRRRVPRGPAAHAGSEGGRWRQSSHHFPVSEQIYEPPKSSPAALQEGWGWGLAGGLFAGNCESTFLHGCVPLCNGNPLSRVKRRPSYHDLLCRFPWIPCTINKKRNFKPVFNPA